MSEKISWITREKKHEVSVNRVYAWRKRVDFLAGFLDSEDRSVMDLGAGDMYLRDILPGGVEYFPVDYFKRYNETIVCDFSKYEFPDMETDVAFISGCLEYIEDVEWFISSIVKSTDKAILHYHNLDNPSPESRLKRETMGFQNHISMEDLLNMFFERGFLLSRFKNRIPEMGGVFLCFIRGTILP